jgi:hypothetical protein
MAKSYCKTLHGEESKLIFVAVVTKEGAGSYILHQNRSIGTDGAVKWTTVGRGATAAHATMDEAILAVDAGVKVAIKGGWRKPAGPAGFKPKPDAFSLTSLPAAKVEVASEEDEDADEFTDETANDVPPVKPIKAKK